MRLTPLFSNAEASGSYLKTLFHIDARDLRFTDSADGMHRAVVDLVAMTFGESDQAVDQTATTYEIPLRGPAYEEALKNGLLYSVAFQVKTAGAYQMRAVVRDGTSGQLGSASQFIEVPDIESGRLTLSSITLREAPPKGNGRGRRSRRATRRFGCSNGRRRSSIAIGFLMLRRTRGRSRRLEAQVRVFRDGRLIYTGKFDALPAAGGVGDPKRLDMGGLRWTKSSRRGTMCCRSW